MTISDELDMLASDTQLGLAGETVTLTPKVSGGWSNAGGSRTDTSPDGPFDVTAIRNAGTRRKKGAGRGTNASYQEAEWQVALADVVAAGVSLIPSIGWDITDGGDTFEVIEVRESVDGRVLTLRGRRD